MQKKTRQQGRVDGAAQVRLAAELYGQCTTDSRPPKHERTAATTAPPIRPGSIVHCDLIPGARLEVLSVGRDAAVLRLANGATLRAGLERLEMAT